MTVATKPVDITSSKKLLEAVGIAMWHVQAFEFTLVYSIVLMFKSPASQTEADAMAAVEKLQQQTLGQLIAALKKGNSTNSVTEFEQRVNRLLQERNWLAHSLFRENQGALYSPEKVPPLVERLTKLSEESLALQKWFGQLADAYVLSKGFTKEQMDAEQLEHHKKHGMV